MCSNIKKPISKTGLTDSALIGYRGHCYKCGAERRLYYVRTSPQIQRKMLNRLKGFKSFCEVCLPKYGLKDTITEWYEMSLSQVDKDLYILGSGIDIDYQKAENDERDNKKNDEWIENQENRVEEYKNYLRKKRN